MYAACAISYLLNDWSGIDIDQATKFIVRCQNYDYAFGFVPDAESHGKTYHNNKTILGASTFLAVASLKLMGKEHLISNKGQIVTWCINKQWGGFQVLFLVV